MTGISAQPLGSHWTKKAQTVESLRCICRGREKNRQSAKLFMEFLHSYMDYLVSQRCRIYQLEQTRIKAGEIPDKLVGQIQGLVNRCNFPTDAEKERHIQLLVLKIKATVANMLAVYCSYVAITDNMSSMGLATKAVNAVQKTNKMSFFICSNCTKHHAPGRDNCPAKDSICHAFQKTGHWKQKFISSQLLSSILEAWSTHQIVQGKEKVKKS